MHHLVVAGRHEHLVALAVAGERAEGVAVVAHGLPGLADVEQQAVLGVAGE